MTGSSLAAALRSCAAGFYPFEAACELLIATCWPLREDFRQFITTGISISDGITPMAAIAWAEAISTLDAGQMPCSDLLTELNDVPVINLRTHRDPCRYGRCSWLKEKMTVPGISVRSWSPQLGDSSRPGTCGSRTA